MNSPEKKRNKFGIFQSSELSCVFYKEDENGNQSTYNIFIFPKENENKIFAFIDNCQMGEKLWQSDNKNSMNDAIRVFNEWAVDAPVLFEIEAHKKFKSFF